MDRITWHKLRDKQRRITKREEALNQEWFKFWKENKDIEQFTEDELVKLMHQLPLSYPRLHIASIIVDRRPNDNPRTHRTNSRT